MDMTTAERRHKILRIICERRQIKMKQLVNLFDVSRPTLINDVFVLSLSYPIYTTKGNGGGVFVMEGFDFEPEKLNQNETDFLNRLALTLTGEDRETMLDIIRKIGGKNETQCI